jgi:hypothetical protein
MIQVRLNDGMILCALCEDELPPGEMVPWTGPKRQITDAELDQLRAANDTFPKELL